MGDAANNCKVMCQNSGLECIEAKIDFQNQKDLFAHFGKSTENGYELDVSFEGFAPFCDDKKCYWIWYANNCSSTHLTGFSKFCACRSLSPVMYQGASVCYDCHRSYSAQIRSQNEEKKLPPPNRTCPCRRELDIHDHTDPIRCAQ